MNHHYRRRHAKYEVAWIDKFLLPHWQTIDSWTSATSPKNILFLCQGSLCNNHGGCCKIPDKPFWSPQIVWLIPLSIHLDAFPFLNPGYNALVCRCFYERSLWWTHALIHTLSGSTRFLNLFAHHHCKNCLSTSKGCGCALTCVLHYVSCPELQ